MENIVGGLLSASGSVSYAWVGALQLIESLALILHKGGSGPNWNKLGRFALNELSPPVARPVENVVPAQVVPIARPVAPIGGVHYVVVKPASTEPFAIASAICGMTAIVPVLSQLLGLTLGIVSLMRLRRAKRAGTPLAGKGWAIAGIATSGFALLGWLGFAAALAGLGSSVLGSSDALNAMLAAPTP